MDSDERGMKNIGRARWLGGQQDGWTLDGKINRWSLKDRLVGRRAQKTRPQDRQTHSICGQIKPVDERTEERKDIDGRTRNPILVQVDRK